MEPQSKRNFSSESKESGYFSASVGSTTSEADHQKKMSEKASIAFSNIVESRKVLYDIFNDVLDELETEPDQWKKSLSSLRETLTSELRFTDIDIAYCENEEMEKFTPGISILALARTRAIVKSGFSEELFRFYQKIVGDNKAHSNIKSCLHRNDLNILHCIAEQTCREFLTKESTLEEKLKSYHFFSKEFPELLDSLDQLQRTPDQIIAESGLSEESSYRLAIIGN